MSVRTALVGAATTVVLVAGLGSPPAQDAARDADASVLLRTVTAIPSWDVGEAPGAARPARPAQGAARDAAASVLLRTVTAIPSWDVGDAPGDVIGGVAVRL